jgi:hypothetical protein
MGLLVDLVKNATAAPANPILRERARQERALAALALNYAVLTHAECANDATALERAPTMTLLCASEESVPAANASVALEQHARFLMPASTDNVSFRALRWCAISSRPVRAQAPWKL